jgi:hypothetical protein
MDLTEQEKKIETPLCEIAFKYGTDKCGQICRPYTSFYYKLLKDKQETIKKVLELGIGYEGNIRYSHPNYRKGASLYMWRDFFPNAQIYGADVIPETMFEDERIKTFFCDERRRSDLRKLIEETGSDINLFVADGSHLKRNQIRTCLTIKPLLKKDAIYVIEDVKYPEEVKNGLSGYDCQVFDFLSRKKKKSFIVLVK